MPILIANSARVSNLADIEDSVRDSRIEIGDNSVIDSFVKFKPAGGNGHVYIGNSVTINSGCVFYSGNGIQIGNGVLVAANCTFAPVNHEYKEKDKMIIQQGFKKSKGGIIIEDDVWIGANTVVLDGAYVQQGCVIAAGSIVRGVLLPYKVYAGLPLQVIGERI